MSCQDLTHTLIESFNALADEVQNLTDRKTILEHKLRYAREQYQYLADKYAPAQSAVSETLTKLQLPPEIIHPALANTSLVPLPRRGDRSDNAQIALFIREGRKVASQLSSMTDPSKGSFTSSKDAVSTDVTTLSAAVLEQDFTVEGKKGQLQCPFSAAPSTVAKNNDAQGHEAAGPGGSDPSGKLQDPKPHGSADPICAAMLEETTSQQQPPSAGASKCPIRFLDQHSTAEIAHYVETHKHEMPRSHEVCIQRYQRNEEQIRKLDAKYGSLVGMIGDLSQLHIPMMPNGEMMPDDVDRASNERVENWAAEVSANDPDAPPEQFIVSSVKEATIDREHADDDDRQSHFDRTLKEVRVGESPSRPWGISVPIMDDTTLHYLESVRPVSPPPAPVQMPPGAPGTPPHPTTARAGAGKCPFDHTKLNGMGRGDMPGIMSSPCLPRTERSNARDSSRQFSFSAAGAGSEFQAEPDLSSSTIPPKQEKHTQTAQAPQQQPTFINPPAVLPKGGQPAPQMVFTGPVFIGYPIEQAIQFMQHFQNGGQQ